MADLGRQLRILIFCNWPSSNANTIVDHITAFSKYSNHQVYVYSWNGKIREALDLSRFDVLIIHYSIYCIYVDGKTRRKISNFKGLKVQFIQDEYRNVNQVLDFIEDTGVDILFTCVPEPEIEKVYPAIRFPKMQKINNLTGFVSEELLVVEAPPVCERPIDIGYRARKISARYGRLGKEKWEIVDNLRSAARGIDVSLDLSYREDERIYGKAWTKFLMSCKLALGVESGASIFDFDGTLERNVETYEKQNPAATYDQVAKKFDLDRLEDIVKMNQISPRCFEAAALRTPMLLFEGEYSGVLQPWRHYIPLKKDFSNLDEVIRHLRDTKWLQNLADQTYKEIACNPEFSYKTFVGKVDRHFEIAVGREPAKLSSRPATRVNYFFNHGYLELIWTVFLSPIPLVSYVMGKIFKISPAKVERFFLGIGSLGAFCSEMYGRFLLLRSVPGSIRVLSRLFLRGAPRSVLLGTFKDMLRLGAIAHVRNSNAYGTKFDVYVRSMPASILVESYPAGTAPPDTGARPADLPLIFSEIARRSEPFDLFWDHSKIDDYLVLSFRSQRVRLHMGESRKYSFASLKKVWADLGKQNSLPH